VVSGPTALKAPLALVSAERDFGSAGELRVNMKTPGWTDSKAHHH
jgi:hypothetical protein